MIRPYQTTDKDQVIEIFKLNTPKYFALSEKEDLVQYLDDLREDYFVMEENGELIGAGGINYFLNENTARISWDFFDPGFQGKGLGRKLLQHRIDKMKENPNIKTIIVRTSQVAFGFYEKSGFQLKDIEKDFWAKGFDLYLMEMNV